MSTSEPSPRARELLERLQAAGASLEQVARAMVLEEEDLERVVDVVERWPWLLERTPK